MIKIPEERLSDLHEVIEEILNLLFQYKKNIEEIL